MVIDYKDTSGSLSRSRRVRGVLRGLESGSTMTDSGTDTGTETDTGARIRKRATNAALQAKLEALAVLGSAGDKGGAAEKEAFVRDHAKTKGCMAGQRGPSGWPVLWAARGVVWR